MLYQEIKEKIKESIERIASEKINLGEIQESKEGDFSFKTFRLGRKLSKAPEKIAKEIAEIKRVDYIKKVEAVGPYVNFFLDYFKILQVLLEKTKEDYGKFPTKGKKIILEHTSVNPSGPIHIGRVRNSFIGDSLVRILKFYGYEVETHFYVNDIGKQIAIISQGYREGLSPDKDITKRYKAYKDKADFQVFFEYVAANRKFAEDEKFQQRVQEQIKRAESGDENALDEISAVGRKCLEGQKETFHKLGISFDSFDFESRYIKNGSVSTVLNFLKKSKYAKEREGGFGLDLEKFGLKRKGGMSVLTRKDGTSVYLSRDLAYHLEKAKLGDEMLNILGEDHKFEFLEVKTILKEILDVSTPLNVVHFSFVNFEGEGLSTRKGNIAPVDQLIAETTQKAEEEIEKRKIAEKRSASVIGIGAIKYHLLKTSPEKPITFKWEEALDFEGDACPYIQYSYARCCSILRNFKGEINEIKSENMSNKELKDEEKTLLKAIMKFPLVVETAAKERRPNLVANYLYQISTEFSRFYKKCQVLGGKRETEERRIFLVKATKIVIKRGLYLLGIESPERM